jgi:dihydrofolate reductase
MSNAALGTKLTLILAATASNGIGKANQLPWRLPKEMAYFSRVTNFIPILNPPPANEEQPNHTPTVRMNAVVMGRKSWEAIPDKYRPLAGRMNVVVSRNEGYQILAEECKSTPTKLYTTSLANAISSLASPTPTVSTSATFSSHPEQPVYLAKIFIIGGGALYGAALDLRTPNDGSFADRILLTRIHEPDYDCDVFFPDFLTRGSSEPSGAGPWKRASHEELEAWVGFDVPKGIVEEKDAKYEFQMWVRSEA